MELSEHGWKPPKPGVQIILFFSKFFNLFKDLNCVLSQLQKPNETLLCSVETQQLQWKLLVWLPCFLGERTSSSHDCVTLRGVLPHLMAGKWHMHPAFSSSGEF